MPKFYVSTHLAREASTIYEVHDDGSHWSISPQGHEHQGSGAVPAGLEIEPEEALRLISDRTNSLKKREREGPTTVPGPVDWPLKGLLQDDVITQDWLAREEWRNNGWGTGAPNDGQARGVRFSRLLRTLRRRSD
jgi:hypothetical protein